MKTIAFALWLNGHAVELNGGQFWTETRGRSRPCVKELGAGPTDEALCRRDLELREDGSLVQTGEISFGADDAITFSAKGQLGASPDPRLRHGTAVFEITGGRGQLAGARGFVTSNFLLSDTGDLKDHQFGLLFLEQPE